MNCHSIPFQVSVDEHHHLWHSLRRTEKYLSRSYPDLDQLEAHLESVREEKIKARKRRRQESANNAAASSSGDEGGATSVKKRARKEANMKTTKMKKAVATAAVAEESEIGGRGGGEEEEEEQEDCSASPSCLRPTGKEVRYFRKGTPSREKKNILLL